MGCAPSTRAVPLVDVDPPLNTERENLLAVALSYKREGGWVKLHHLCLETNKATEQNMLQSCAQSPVTMLTWMTEPQVCAHVWFLVWSAQRCVLKL